MGREQALPTSPIREQKGTPYPCLGSFPAYQRLARDLLLGMADAPTPAPGWYPDPAMAGTQRYWTGEAWSDHVAPISPPSAPGISAWKGIRIVAVGVLAALAVVWVVVQMNRPSDVDCAVQQADVVLGERDAVEDACVGR